MLDSSGMCTSKSLIILCRRGRRVAEAQRGQRQQQTTNTHPAAIEKESSGTKCRLLLCEFQGVIKKVPARQDAAAAAAAAEIATFLPTWRGESLLCTLCPTGQWSVCTARTERTTPAACSSETEGDEGGKQRRLHKNKPRTTLSLCHTHTLTASSYRCPGVSMVTWTTSSPPSMVNGFRGKDAEELCAWMLPCCIWKEKERRERVGQQTEKSSTSPSSAEITPQFPHADRTCPGIGELPLPYSRETIVLGR